MPESEDLRKLAIRREMLIHEDNQLNARLGFHLTTQSILITGATLLLNNQLLQLKVIGTFMLLISVVAVALTLSFRRALIAAVREQARLLGSSDVARPGNDRVLAFEDERYRQILQASGRTKVDGLSHVPWVVWIVIPTWSFLFALGAILIVEPHWVARLTP